MVNPPLKSLMVRLEASLVDAIQADALAKGQALTVGVDTPSTADLNPPAATHDIYEPGRTIHR